MTITCCDILLYVFGLDNVRGLIGLEVFEDLENLDLVELETKNRL